MRICKAAAVLKGLVACMLCLVFLGPLPHQARAAYDNTTMRPQVSVPGGETIVQLEAVNEPVRDVLHQLSRKAGFNLMMDPSVSGTITVDLDNVSVNQALESVASIADIHIIPRNGNIFLAISREEAERKGVSRQFSKVIKVYYTSARRIAQLMNTSLFAAPGQSGNVAERVRYDARTNSIIVMGTQDEIRRAEEAMKRLDQPRQSKTFYLSHANALDVATMLASSLFNEGTGVLQIQGGGAAGGGAANDPSQVIPGMLRVEQEDVEEGEGVNDFGRSNQNAAPLSQGVTLRGQVKSSQTIQVSPEGPIVIPDTRTNSITIMGTAEQIALAEAYIPVVDAQLPQVAIEASLIEVSSSGLKELESLFGHNQDFYASGFNNNPVDFVDGINGTGLFGVPTQGADGLGRSAITFSTNPIDQSLKHNLNFRLRSLINQNKAKILANPTVVATHDTESIIAITDEIVRRTTVEVEQLTGFTTQTIEIGEAGIVMDILPKVGDDGTITMRLRPSISTIRQITEDSLGNIVTLLSRRDLLTQAVRVQDGQTLVIGGLVSEQDMVSADKLPLLGDLPIVGALARASSRNNSRSEVVLMITPHILNKTELTPVSFTQPTWEIPATQTSPANGWR